MKKGIVVKFPKKRKPPAGVKISDACAEYFIERPPFRAVPLKQLKTLPDFSHYKLSDLRKLVKNAFPKVFANGRIRPGNGLHGAILEVGEDDPWIDIYEFAIWEYLNKIRKNFDDRIEPIYKVIKVPFLATI